MIGSNSGQSFEEALNANITERKRSKRILKKLNENHHGVPNKPNKRFKVVDMSQDDSDDDFEIVGCIDAIKWFYPVDKKWQQSKCEKLKLNLKRELACNYNEPVPANAPMEIHEIEGDGNCYFRCLSYLITGTDKSHRLIRHKLVKFMRENEKMVEGLGGRNYLNKSLMWTDGMWPTEVEIYVSACMLDTDIYTYMDEKWLRFSSSGKLELHDKVERAIYLQNKENVHYDVVLQVQEPKLVTLKPLKVYGPQTARSKKFAATFIDVDKIVENEPKRVLELQGTADTHTLPLETVDLVHPTASFYGPRRKLDVSVLKDL